MAQPIAIEERIKALESRILLLEKALQVSAGQIILQAGMSKIAITNNNIVLDSTGAIRIEADRDFELTASGGIEIKAGKDIHLKGQRILQN
jgi:hypothetical protein